MFVANHFEQKFASVAIIDIGKIGVCRNRIRTERIFFSSRILEFHRENEKCRRMARVTVSL